MAGIGFVLRKLTDRGDILGLLQAYTHSAVSSAGGWLFTILTLSVITFFGPTFASYADLSEFRLIVVYNFGASLVLTGPIALVVTRHLSDRIFARQVDGIPGLLVGALAMATALAVPTAAPFYFWYVELPTTARVAAFVGYLLVSWIWVVSVFLSTLKSYSAISGTFAIGMGIALLSAWRIGPNAGVHGMLAGFNVGLAVIVFVLVGRVFVEFPYGVRSPFAFVREFRGNWELALGGFVYYAGVWVDKWIMWFGPEREMLPSGLISYPDYDSAAFLASVTIVPSMAVFVVSIETEFFEAYHRFYRDIAGHATYRRIRLNQGALVQAVFDGARQLVLLQAGLMVALVVLAPSLFDTFGIPFGQLGIFRIATLGAFFQLLFLLLTIVLSYLDLNRLGLYLHCGYFVSNAGLTWLTMRLGFPYYGYGYCAASILAFGAASLVTLRCLDQLPYHAFITGNASVRRPVPDIT